MVTDEDKFETLARLPRIREPARRRTHLRAMAEVLTAEGRRPKGPTAGIRRRWPESSPASGVRSIWSQAVPELPKSVNAGARQACGGLAQDLCNTRLGDSQSRESQPRMA